MTLVSLDTNAYIALLKGDKRVNDALSSATRIYISIVVIAELLSGFRGGSQEKPNRQKLDEFLAKPVVQVIEANINTADLYSLIKHDLKKNGTPIPTNDIWIAAHAMETGSVLITFDKHFEFIKGLRTWK